MTFWKGRSSCCLMGTREILGTMDRAGRYVREEMVRISLLSTMLARLVNKVKASEDSP